MKLHLVRGLPGSGKSTYAKGLGMTHFEADMFFMKDGEYRFDPTQLKTAHEWCRKSAAEALEAGKDVVVSNTFSQHWEMWPYIDLAIDHNAVLLVTRCVGKWASMHGVPSDTIEKMRARWEDWKGEYIL